MANPKNLVSSLSTHWDTLGICGLCDRGVLAVFENSTKEFYGGAFDDFLTANLRLIGVFPSPPLSVRRPTPPTMLLRSSDKPRQTFQRTGMLLG